MNLLKNICQKWILEQIQYQERTDDIIAKVWIKVVHFSTITQICGLKRNCQEMYKLILVWKSYTDYYTALFIIP